MAPKYLSGKAEVAMNGIAIPATLLSEVNVEFTGGTRSIESLGGTFNQPTGVLETAQATFTMFLPSMDYLKNIFPDMYNAPSGSQLTGNVIWGDNSCMSMEGTPVNISYSCDTTDDNDFHIYNGLVNLDFSATYNATDVLTVEVTIMAQPDVNGNIGRAGTGDLTQPSRFDPTTGTTVPVTS